MVLLLVAITKMYPTCGKALTYLGHYNLYDPELSILCSTGSACSMGIESEGGERTLPIERPKGLGGSSGAVLNDRTEKAAPADFTPILHGAIPCVYGQRQKAPIAADST